MRVTEKGQVTIPQAIREAVGMRPGTEVEFRMDADGAVRLVRCGDTGSRIDRAVEAMRGRATTRMTTDEIMALTRGEPGN